jgi:hypothetical protein
MFPFCKRSESAKEIAISKSSLKDILGFYTILEYIKSFLEFA